MVGSMAQQGVGVVDEQWARGDGLGDVDGGPPAGHVDDDLVQVVRLHGLDLGRQLVITLVPVEAVAKLVAALVVIEGGRDGTAVATVVSTERTSSKSETPTGCEARAKRPMESRRKAPEDAADDHGQRRRRWGWGRVVDCDCEL